jgi:hypothetical protein
VDVSAHAEMSTPGGLSDRVAEGVVRTWQRATLRTFCGFCSAEIHAGDPVLVLQRYDAHWKALRCTTCAGERVPELPELERVDIQPVRKSKPFSMASVAALAADYKIKQSGDD